MEPKTYNQVSRLQFPVLTALSKPGAFLTTKEARALDQRPLGSLFRRGWIAYRPGRGFHLTKLGREAYEEYLHEARHRKRPDLPLSHYFDPIAYQLEKPPLKIVKRSAA